MQRNHGNADAARSFSTQLVQERTFEFTNYTENILELAAVTPPCAKRGQFARHSCGRDATRYAPLMHARMVFAAVLALIALIGAPVRADMLAPREIPSYITDPLARAAF